jgi:hypothetical protein
MQNSERSTRQARVTEHLTQLAASGLNGEELRNIVAKSAKLALPRRAWDIKKPWIYPRRVRPAAALHPRTQEFLGAFQDVDSTTLGNDGDPYTAQLKRLMGDTRGALRAKHCKRRVRKKYLTQHAALCAAALRKIGKDAKDGDFAYRYERAPKGVLAGAATIAATYLSGKVTKEAK